MPKVYCPNKAGHDYEDAKRHGEIVFVTTGTQNKYSVQQMYRTWVEVLQESKPEDLIILTGLNIICTIGCSVFAVMHGRLNLLIWRNNRYISREIVMGNLLGGEDEQCK
jgi:hypothetical protein